MTFRKAEARPEEIRQWCASWLGSEQESSIFEAGYLSKVVGLRLVDGREVVLKVREGQDRLEGCSSVQRHLFDAGFPCPELLAGPAPFGEWMATCETHLPGGDLVPTGEAPVLFAKALAELIKLAPSPESVPSLQPTPAWAAWDHQEPGLWPTPDDRATDLNAHEGPAWLDDTATKVREFLAGYEAPQVIGHCDWYSGNLRWIGNQLHAVHDWDSVISQPETTIAGLASAIVPGKEGPEEVPDLGESQLFLETYAKERSFNWSLDDWRACWAAGLWVRAFDAKKQLTEGRIRALTEEEAQKRLDVVLR